MLDFTKVKAFIFDIDGVLTDGNIYLLDNHEIKRTNIKDGYALQLAVKRGFHVGIISGGRSQLLKQRLNYLGIKDIFLHVANKLTVYESLLQQWQIEDQQVVYVGDDMPDYVVMKKSGIAVAPANAASDILKIADYVTKTNGGEGVAREIIELVLKAQNLWYEENYKW